MVASHRRQMIFAEFNLLTFLPYSELLISTTCNIERQYYISNTFHYKLHFLIIKFHVWNIFNDIYKSFIINKSHLTWCSQYWLYI